MYLRPYTEYNLSDNNCRLQQLAAVDAQRPPGRRGHGERGRVQRGLPAVRPRRRHRARLLRPAPRLAGGTQMYANRTIRQAA